MFGLKSRSQPNMPRPNLQLRLLDPCLKNMSLFGLMQLHFCSEEFSKGNQDIKTLVFHHGFTIVPNNIALSPPPKWTNDRQVTLSKRPVRHCSICRRHYTRHYHLSQTKTLLELMGGNKNRLNNKNTHKKQ